MVGDGEEKKAIGDSLIPKKPIQVSSAMQAHRGTWMRSIFPRRKAEPRQILRHISRSIVMRRSGLPRLTLHLDVRVPADKMACCAIVHW